MRILFFMRHQGYVRNFQAVLEQLAARGHEVEVAFDPHRTPWLAGRSPLDLVRAEQPQITQSDAPARSGGPWPALVTPIRETLDVLRYHEPAYADARALRARAERRAPGVVPKVLALPGARSAAGRRAMTRMLAAAEAAAPVDPGVRAFLEARRPDVVLVTPLIGLGSTQGDYVRAAQALGIPVIHAVASWDNLTNKGLIRDVPDVVQVWNEPQKAEAVGFHHVPADRVAVTGAHSYDHWFGWEAATTREAFCAQVGLRADRPFVLYVGSSRFIAPHETGFVRRWLQALRSREGSPLAEAGVLVRPHPQNAEQWRADDLGDLADVAIWPPAGADPVDAASRAAFYDSIHHSAAVVGINTSAQIESAIAGRSVFTVLDAEFADTQGGTLHFEHLARDEGGLLQIAASLHEHGEHLERALAGDPQLDARRRAFLERFVRPYGLDEPAAPRVVAVVEEAAQRAALARRERPVLRALLTPLALVLDRLQRRIAARRERLSAEALPSAR